MRRSLKVVLAASVMALAMHGFSLAEPGGTRGAKFQLRGGAADATDPENATNDVVAFDNTANFAAATRTLHDGTKVEQLDNQVQLRYFFVGTKTCVFASGTPRIQLAVDTDGDGTANGNAFGYLGDKAFGGGCPSNTWLIEDFTNVTPNWDISQLGGPQAINWDGMEAFIQGTFPNHQVLRGALIEDPAAGNGGITYYDSLVIGNRDINVHADTADA